MQKRNVLNSPRLVEIQKKKKKIFLNKVFVFLAIFVIVLIGLSFLSRWPKINIRDVAISGNKVTDTKKIEEAVREEISGHYLWFFPKTNFLFYPKSEIKNRLASDFKRLRDLEVGIVGDNTLGVTMGERVGSYTWCGDDLPSVSASSEDSGCYFMDETGYVFDEAPYFSRNVYFRFFGKLDGEGESKAGSYFAPSTFKELIGLKKSLETMKLKPSFVVVKEDGDVEMYLVSNSSFSNSQKIIFRIDSDFQKIAENLQVALDTEPLKSDFKNKYSSLLYIDLRFGNKVYYKFANSSEKTQ